MKNFLNDEAGASAAEYALILAVVGSGIAFAAFTLGQTITTAIDNAEEDIRDPASATPAGG
ncbi:MAG: Flp family type IVb pilin [Alphaproteobacteria bacterium HGW-Alphaproteobacteria-15]|nr:MAG: Flp family type IVb pilin [Alphaproteobacteria bacterium HGW-Alphaproteobacteria-15]